MRNHREILKPGLAPLYAVEVDDIRVDEAAGTMTVYAPTAVIRDRGDTLNRAMLTVTFSAPAPGVVKVRVERHAGAVHRGPDFEVLEMTFQPSEVWVRVTVLVDHSACGGTTALDNIVWGTVADLDNIVWGTFADGDNIVWGTRTGRR